MALLRAFSVLKPLSQPRACQHFADAWLPRAFSSQTDTHDVIVIGLGALGSATLYHLAKMGTKVLGIDQFKPGHDQGSSHGFSRIFRFAYVEGDEYVPLLKRSMVLFKELEAETNTELFYKTGILDIGPIFRKSLKSAQIHSLPYEVLTGAEVNARFPGYNIPEAWTALYQPDGGVLAPEKIIQSHVQQAVSRGALVKEGERVLGWKAVTGKGPAAQGVEVATTSGTYRASRLVIAPGAWMGSLVPELAEVCVPERQVVGWFKSSNPKHFRKESFPGCIIAEDDSGKFGFYAMPEYGQEGFKLGWHHHLQERVSPDSLARNLTPEDEAVLRRGVERYFPTANGPLLSHSACIYTNTPDGHFIVDKHPAYPQVLLGSACSGHGFKLCAVLGEALAFEAMNGAGTCSLDDWMHPHRVNPLRAGHTDFIDACLRNAASDWRSRVAANVQAAAQKPPPNHCQDQ